MRRRTVFTSMLAVPASMLVAAPARADIFPEIIALPNGWRPEGIAIGRGAHFYVGSLANGAIYRGSLVTGQGSVFVPGEAGKISVGLEIDCHERIWACGGPTGGARVFDGATGALLATYAFGGAFVNDAVATESAVYFTDSQRPFLYRVRLTPGGGLPDPTAVEAIPAPGPLGEAGAFNNGIEVTWDGKLIVVQSTADRLVTLVPSTMEVGVVDLHGASVLRGDGIIRRGLDLYVMRNRLNLLAKFRLNAHATEATLISETTHPRFDVPATIALFGPWVYAVNARFTTTPTPDTPYHVVRTNA